jgi:hypothetical protein
MISEKSSTLGLFVFALASPQGLFPSFSNAGSVPKFCRVGEAATPRNPPGSSKDAQFELDLFTAVVRQGRSST